MEINLDQVLKDLKKGGEPLNLTDVNVQNIKELDEHIGSKIENALCKNCKEEINKIQGIRKDEPFTLRIACRDSIAGSYNPEMFPSQKGLSPKDVQIRYRLWQKLDANKKGELFEYDSDDLKLLKDLTGQNYLFRTLILGQVWDMLEQKNEKQPKANKGK